MKKWFQKNKKETLFIIAIVLMISFLCTFSLRSTLKIEAIVRLKNNLDFVGQFLTRYPWLATVVVVAIIIFLLMKNFSLNSTTVKILGVEFQMKHTESSARIQVKNYLSSKRSIFVIYEEYDNYYDVINSMYEILMFLRNQLANFDNFAQTNNDCYKNIEGIIKEVAKFLTKYHSDYRRYYEQKINQSDNGFIPFKQIQNEYCKEQEILADFKTLNRNVQQYAKYFEIDVEKWTGWYS